MTVTQLKLSEKLGVKYLLRGQLGRYRRDAGESVHRSEVYGRRLYLVLETIVRKYNST